MVETEDGGVCWGSGVRRKEQMQMFSHDYMATREFDPDPYQSHPSQWFYHYTVYP